MTNNSKYVGRYTLMHKGVFDMPDEKIKLPSVVGVFRTNVTLAEIDNITTGFESAKDLMDFLNKAGYDFRNSHFYIGYNYNKKKKELPVAYSNQKMIKLLAEKTAGKSKITKDYEFAQYTINLLETVVYNTPMMGFLLKEGYISERLYNSIFEYINCNKNDLFVLRNCRDHVRSLTRDYKAFRDLEMGIQAYQEEMELARKNEERRQAKVLKRLPSKPVKVEKPKPVQGRLFNPDDFK